MFSGEAAILESLQHTSCCPQFFVHLACPQNEAGSTHVGVELTAETQCLPDFSKEVTLLAFVSQIAVKQ